MRTKFFCLLGFCALVVLPGVRADEKGQQVKLKLGKGQAAEYLVKREGSTNSESSRGEFKSKDESEAAYRIEVTEEKDGGNLVLKVTIPKLRARIEGRDEPWEFDSTKSEGGGEVGSYFREVLSKPLTVTVKYGALK